MGCGASDERDESYARNRWPAVLPEGQRAMTKWFTTRRPNWRYAPADSSSGGAMQ
jgi:hypothetical protein